MFDHQILGGAAKICPISPPSTKSCMVGLLGVEPPIYAVCNLSRGLLALRNFRKPISLRVNNFGKLWVYAAFGIVFASNHDF